MACAEGEEYEEVQAGSQEICVEKDSQVRVPDDKCDGDSSHTHYYWWYHGSSYGPAPAVGSRANMLHGSAVKPGGTVARPPATGGFGTFRASVGS